MDGNDKAIISDSGEIISRIIVENTLGKRGLSELFSRYNPFSEKYKNLTIQEIIDLETTGSLESDLVSNDDLVEHVVRNAIYRLPNKLREVVIAYFFQGKSVGDIAKEMHTSPVNINNIRLSAMDKLGNLITEERFEAGLFTEFYKCPICSNLKCSEINEKLHLWLDSKGWHFHGLLALLNKEYSLDIKNKVELLSHIKYHMNIKVSDYISIDDTYDDSDEISNNMLSLYIKIPTCDDNEISRLSSEFNMTKASIIRQAMSIGLHIYSMMLKTNKYLEEQQLKINKFISRFN